MKSNVDIEHELVRLYRSALAWDAAAIHFDPNQVGKPSAVMFNEAERVFATVQVNFEETFKLSYPQHVLTGAQFMTHEQADKITQNLDEYGLGDWGAYDLWLFRGYAERKASSIRDVMKGLVKWGVYREAKSLFEAKELVELVARKLFLIRPSWKASADKFCQYAEMDVYGSRSMIIGVSTDGLVSVDGDPYTPDARVANIMLSSVEKSIRARVGVLRQRPINSVPENEVENDSEGVRP